MATLKGLGFALLAIAVMALTSGTAMAESTALCTENTAVEGACPQAKRAGHIHFVTQKLLNGNQVGTRGVLLEIFGATVFKTECEILLLGTVQTAGNLGSPLVIHANFTYANCANGCSMEEINGAQGVVKILKEGNELGKVTFENYEILVECGSHCIYEVGQGHFLGPATPNHKGHITFTQVVMPKVGGFFCPTEAKLDVLFLSLENLYIRL